MAVGSTSSSKSSAPTSSPRPTARPSTTAKANTSASAGAGASVGASAGVTSGAKTTSSSAAAASPSATDSVKLDRSELKDGGEVSSDLMSGLSDAYGAEDSAETNSAAPASETDGVEGDKPVNPYSDVADHTVSMKPEAWSSDRTPGEGNVARNDHLEGMLRNQGFEVSELYSKDANGQTLIDRVAEANGLRDANLITPDQELTLPTRHVPKEESGGSAEAVIAGETVENLGADASAEVTADKVKDADLDAEATAKATNTGEGGAFADADAQVKVEEAVNSEITARAEAEADAASGREQATATAGVDAGKVVDSSVDTTAKAVSDNAIAEATTDIEEAVGSEVTTKAIAQGEDASADADTEIGKATETSVNSVAAAQGDGAEATGEVDVEEMVASAVDSQVGALGDDAAAENNVDVDTATGSAIKAETDAVGDGAEASTNVDVDEAKDTVINAATNAVGDETEADTTVNVDEMNGGTVLGETSAEGAGSEAVTEVNVGEAEAAEIAAAAGAQGDGSAATSDVTVGEASEDTRVVSQAVAEGDGATSDASAHLGSGLPGDQTGEAKVVAAATGDAQGSLSGAADGNLTVLSEQGEAAAELDAAEGHLTAAGQDVDADFEGIHNASTFDVSAEGTVELHDRGMVDELGSLAPMYTGNTIAGSAQGQDLDLRARASSGVDVDFTGLEGDNNVSASLPGAGGADLGLNLGNGDDSVSAIRRNDDQAIDITKTEGTLNLNTHAEDRTYQDSTQTFIDAGEATVNGTIRGGNYASDDTTMIRGGEFGNLRVDGGQGDNDSLVIDLAEGAAIPAIVTREASNGLWGLGARDAEGILPEGYQPGDNAIMADGIENIVVRDHNGEIVSTWGGEVEGLQSFDEAREAALQ